MDNLLYTLMAGQIARKAVDHRPYPTPESYVSPTNDQLDATDQDLRELSRILGRDLTGQDITEILSHPGHWSEFASELCDAYQPAQSEEQQELLNVSAELAAAKDEIERLGRELEKARTQLSEQARQLANRVRPYQIEMTRLSNRLFVDGEQLLARYHGPEKATRVQAATWEARGKALQEAAVAITGLMWPVAKTA